MFTQIDKLPNADNVYLQLDGVNVEVYGQMKRQRSSVANRSITMPNITFMSVAGTMMGVEYHNIIFGRKLQHITDNSPLP